MRFNAVLDGYFNGTASIEDFAPLVSSEFLETFTAEEANVDRSTRTVGASSFGEEKLVDAQTWGGYGEIALVVCRDVSNTYVVDASGDRVDSARVRDRIPMIVFFRPGEDPEPALVITKVDQWNEDGYCA